MIYSTSFSTNDEVTASASSTPRTSSFTPLNFFYLNKKDYLNSPAGWKKPNPDWCHLSPTPAFSRYMQKPELIPTEYLCSKDDRGRSCAQFLIVVLAVPDYCRCVIRNICNVVGPEIAMDIFTYVVYSQKQGGVQRMDGSKKAATALGLFMRCVRHDQWLTPSEKDCILTKGKKDSRHWR